MPLCEDSQDPPSPFRPIKYNTPNPQPLTPIFCPLYVCDKDQYYVDQVLHRLCSHWSGASCRTTCQVPCRRGHRRPNRQDIPLSFHPVNNARALPRHFATHYPPIQYYVLNHSRARDACVLLHHALLRPSNTRNQAHHLRMNARAPGIPAIIVRGSCNMGSRGATAQG